MAETEASVGLSVIRAREAPIAVVFRRGPTKQVRMCLWHMDRDAIDRGQWLAARIYPERCDLSPDGKLVVYFGNDGVPYTVTKPHARLTDLELQRRPAPTVRATQFQDTDRDAYAFRLFDRKHDVAHDLGTADWMDWHPSGDLAIARDGLITRTAIVRRAPGDAHTIASFTDDVFEKLPPASWATEWPAR